MKANNKEQLKAAYRIYNPTIARVKVHYDIFLESYERQKNYQALTNRSLDELASMRGRADELILDIWNQVEAKYQDVTPNDTRLEKCRDYGLIYYYRSSEKVKEEKKYHADRYSFSPFVEEFTEDCAGDGTCTERREVSLYFYAQL